MMTTIYFHETVKMVEQKLSIVHTNTYYVLSLIQQQYYSILLNNTLMKIGMLSFGSILEECVELFNMKIVIILLCQGQ